MFLLNFYWCFISTAYLSVLTMLKNGTGSSETESQMNQI